MHNMNTKRTNGCPYADRPLSRRTDGVAKPGHIHYLFTRNYSIINAVLLYRFALHRTRAQPSPTESCVAVCAHAAVVHKNNTNESVCHYGEQLLGKNSASFKLYGRRLTCSSTYFVSNIQDYALFFLHIF